MPRMRVAVFFAAALPLVLAAPAMAQQPVLSGPFPYTALGYQQMTTLTSAAVLPNIPNNALFAIVICTGQTVNWRDDGTAPTASVGMPLPTNTQIIFSERPLSVVQIIQTAATATCNVSYYKQSGG